MLAQPLPDGRVQPQDALWFGVSLTLLGLGYLATAVNLLSAVVAAAITLSYLLIYTPMKRASSLCVPVGAIPGALPPVIGWVAARGELSVDAWVLFAIMFLWQIPHTLAIAYLYREDFAKAGIQFLPVIEPDGDSTNRQILIHCAALLVVPAESDTGVTVNSIARSCLKSARMSRPTRPTPSCPAPESLATDAGRRAGAC